MGNIKLALTRVLVAGCCFVALLLKVGTITSVRADNFYPTGDVKDCDFATATSLSYFMLPPNCNQQGCVSFDPTDLRGESGNYPYTHRISDVAYLTYPDAHRIWGIADSVAVPPNTQVDIGFFVHNYSKHDVSVPSAYVFLSRANLNNGDWGKLGAEGVIGNINYNYFGVSKVRLGRYKHVHDLGVYVPNTHATVPLGRTIYSFHTIQPLNIRSRDVNYEFDTNGNLILNYYVNIENISSYDLNNIKIIDIFPNEQKYEILSNFNAKETKDFFYSVNLGTDYERNINILPLTVIDPNYHREYVAVANGIASDSESKTLLINRTDVGSSFGWTGIQPDFSTKTTGEYYYIELIPYTVYSEILNIDVAPKVSVKMTVSDFDEQEVTTNHVSPNEHFNVHFCVSNTGGNAKDLNLLLTIDSTLSNIIASDGGVVTGNQVSWNINTLLNGQSICFSVLLNSEKELIDGIYEHVSLLDIIASDWLTLSDSVITVIKSEVKLEMDLNIIDSDEFYVKGNTIDVSNVSSDEMKVSYIIDVKNTGNGNCESMTIVLDYTEIANYSKIVGINYGGYLEGFQENDLDVKRNVVWNIESLKHGQTTQLIFDVIYDLEIEDKSVFELVASTKGKAVDMLNSLVTTLVINPPTNNLSSIDYGEIYLHEVDNNYVDIERLVKTGSGIGREIILSLLIVAGFIPIVHVFLSPPVLSKQTKVLHTGKFQS